MLRPSKAALFLFLCATLALPLAAAADPDVAVSLEAHKVTSDARGKESFVPGDQAGPGDVIEYRARYTNQGAGAVKQLVATLPIPAGVEYLPATARPAIVLASLDGRSFAPIPLKRTVRLPDGREVTREIPASEYRWLRWTIGSLAPKNSEIVRARVRIPAPAVAAAVTR
jgi:uncharacterized repeat protein (TIGR01451 family)